MFVKPAPGLLVRDPVNFLVLPEDGAEVPNTSYWRRRLKAGDAIKAKPAKARSSKSSKGEA